MALRLIPAPNMGGPPPVFNFQNSAPPQGQGQSSAATGSSRAPAAISAIGGNQGILAPITPVKRLPYEAQNVFHARPMDHGEPGMRKFKCPDCLKVVQEPAAGTHKEQCKQIQAQLEAMRSSVAIKAGGRKGQKAGLKRAGSELPQPTSPAPSNDSPRKPGTAKRQKIEKAESIASTDDYPHPLAGTVDPESGRLYQESGKLETKKQHEKRMVEERRLQREQSKQTKNTKGGGSTKEYNPDIHCGVATENNNWQPCKRKLECKVHHNKDKELVLGRSHSFKDCLRIAKGEDVQGSIRGDDTPPIGESGNPLDVDGVDGSQHAGGGSQHGTSVNGNAMPGQKAKRGRKKHQEGRRMASGGIDALGVGSAEFDALVQAVRGHMKRNNYNVRMKMFSLASAVEEVKPTKAVAAAAAAKDESVPPPMAAKGDPDAGVGGNDNGDVEMQASQPAPTGPTTGSKARNRAPGTTKGLMRFQTFAGGATSGHWHGERRRLMTAENAMNEIFKEIKQNRDGQGDKMDTGAD